jgi:hypothetical protein
LHNKSVAAKSHYAFKSNFWGSPQNEVYFLLLISQILTTICLAIVRLRKLKVFLGFAHNL